MDSGNTFKNKIPLYKHIYSYNGPRVSKTLKKLKLPKIPKIKAPSVPKID